MRQPRLWAAIALAASLAGVALLVGAGPAAAATTYTCANNYSVDDPGLQTAINGGGTVNVVGHCLGNWNVNNDVTLQGVGNAILDGDQVDRVLEISSGLTVTIRSLTITGGVTSSNGGGIDISSSTLTLVNVLITGNQTCSTCYGGGIEAYDDVLTLIGTTVSKNFAGQGGGLNPYAGSQTSLIGSSIVSNIATNLGGGIYNEPNNGTVLSVSSSRIAWNTSYFLGGGIYNDQSEVQISNNSSVDHNTAYEGGGGIFNTNGIGPGPEAAPALFPKAAASLAPQAHRVTPYQLANDGDALLLIDNSTVSLNNVPGSGFPDGGGGIYNAATNEHVATVQATNMRLGGNRAKYGLGGGIANVNFDGDSALVTLAGTPALRVLAGSLNDNQAALGGGVFNVGFGGTADVAFQAKTAVVHNQAFESGGGLFNACSGTFSIAPGVVFLGNTPQNIDDEADAFCLA